MRQFLRTYRSDIIARAMATLRTVAELPQATAAELEKEVALFLDELLESIKESWQPSEKLRQSAARQGHHMQRLGIPLAQVVHAYGDTCQAMTELAAEKNILFTPGDYYIFNGCLDLAISEAVTAYVRATEHSAGEQERLGSLAHELRNSVNTALLAFDVLRRGQAGIDGSAGAVLHRSLINLRDLIDSALTNVRIESGHLNQQPIGLADFIRDVTAAAAMQAQARQIRLVVTPVEPALAVTADRQLLTSALTNLLYNALKFTHPRGLVSLRAYAAKDRIRIEVEDECGGLPTDKIDDLFRPFAQQGEDRTGLGLGLTISRRAVEACGGEITVRNLPGKGCVFIIELPYEPSAPAGSALKAHDLSE